MGGRGGREDPECHAECELAEGEEGRSGADTVWLLQRDLAEESSWSLTYLKDVAEEITSEEPSASSPAQPDRGQPADCTQLYQPP